MGCAEAGETPEVRASSMRSEKGRAALHSGTTARLKLTGLVFRKQQTQSAKLKIIYSRRGRGFCRSDGEYQVTCFQGFPGGLPLQLSTEETIHGFPFLKKWIPFIKTLARLLNSKCDRNHSWQVGTQKTINFREHWPKENPHLVRGTNKEPEESLLISKELLGDWKHFETIY